MTRLILTLMLLATLAEAQKIPVTNTWGELRAAKPHAVGDELTVRLGVDATRPARSGTAQIYILVEGLAEDQDCPVRLVRDGQANRLMQRMRQIPQEQQPIDGPRIYLHTERMPTSGDSVVIEAQDLHGNTLAAVELTPGPFVDPGWFGLRKPQIGRALQRQNGQPDLLRARLDRPAQRPRMDTRRPLAIHEDADQDPQPPADDAALPTLHPSTPSPQLRIAREGKKIRVSCARAIRISPSLDHLLVRLWHNGEVVVPKGEILTLQNSSGQVRDAKTFLLEIDFERASLGIKADAPLEIELMHCPERKFIGEGMMQVQASLLALGRARLPLLSNRLPLP